jgi:hypothetical protein
MDDIVRKSGTDKLQLNLIAPAYVSSVDRLRLLVLGNLCFSPVVEADMRSIIHRRGSSSGDRGDRSSDD